MKTEKEEERQVIKVNQNECKFAEYPNIIETMGLGPCIGIIIHDPEKKAAFVGHYPEPRLHFNEIFDKSKEFFKDKKRLKVYIGGGAPDIYDAPNFTTDKEIRKFVKNKLEEEGFHKSQITTKYQDSTEITVMRVDTFLGTVEYDVIDFFNDGEEQS